jgi:hypothetical membrane protein
MTQFAAEQIDAAPSGRRGRSVGDWFDWAGVAGPILYVVTVVVGGSITPGYSHAANAISELVQTGAAHRTALNLALAVFNGLILLFAVGLVRRSRSLRGAGIAVGAGLLIAAVIAGLAMTPFAMDPIGQPATFIGIGHIILAGLASLFSLGSLLAFAIGLRRVRGGQPWSTYAALSLTVTLVTGAVAAYGAARLWPTMGLWERFTIGANLQWVFAFALALATGRVRLEMATDP